MTQFDPSQPAQPQKHTVRTVVLIVLGVAVLALPAFWVILLGYTGVRTLIANQETHQVVYKVTGTAKNPDIRFSTKGDLNDTTLPRTPLPWESPSTKTKGMNQIFFVHVSPQTGETGTLHCEIWMDGKLVDRADPQYGYLGADCTYQP
jgi:hypothetical protein